MPRNRTLPSSRSLASLLERPALLHLRAARGHVHLDEVEVVGLQPAQTLLDARADVRRAVVVGVRAAARRRAPIERDTRTSTRGRTRRDAR